MDISAEDLITADKLNVLYDKTKYTCLNARYKKAHADGSLEYGIKLLLEPLEESPLKKVVARGKQNTVKNKC